jgi:SAM-dependent methyltransferase
MTDSFSMYADVYDDIYSDKDYAAEAEYVAKRLLEERPDTVSVLELGCGTGRHAEYLARSGLHVTGLDLSRGMIERALARRAALPAAVAARLTFSTADLRTARLGTAFDAVIALFHVVSFLITPADLAAAFRTVAAHLPPGGLFLFDFWYGPAVVSQRPRRTRKIVRTGQASITRTSQPRIDLESRTVQVDTVIVSDRPAGAQSVRCTHAVRYWFPAELEEAAGNLFEVLATDAWMERHSATADSWSAMQLLRRTAGPATAPQ